MRIGRFPGWGRIVWKTSLDWYAKVPEEMIGFPAHLA
jgi:hypothetical protein